MTNAQTIYDALQRGRPILLGHPHFRLALNKTSYKDSGDSVRFRFYEMTPVGRASLSVVRLWHGAVGPFSATASGHLAFDQIRKFERKLLRNLVNHGDLLTVETRNFVHAINAILAAINGMDVDMQGITLNVIEGQ